MRGPCDISMRRGNWFFPKTMLESRTAEWTSHASASSAAGIVRLMIRIRFGSWSRYGLPEPDYRPFDKHPIVNEQLSLSVPTARPGPARVPAPVGYTVHFVDAPIATTTRSSGTGFEIEFPFLDRDLFPCTMGPCAVANLLPQIANLYLFGLLQPRGGAGPLSAAVHVPCADDPRAGAPHHPLANDLARFRKPSSRMLVGVSETMREIRAGACCRGFWHSGRGGGVRGDRVNGGIPLQETTLHGHRVGFRMAGDGPLIVLIHGITSTSDVWLDAMARLAERYTVVAPDLLGHGRSAKPRGDYSLGAYASGARDLLGVLGFERGTVVGHSLGGGIALQFAYQFPEYCERLVLVSSGGLGKEVHPLLRAGGAPGLRAGAAADRPRLGDRAPGRRSPSSSSASASRPGPTSPRRPAATRRSPTATRAMRSSTRCGPSSTWRASGSAPPTASTWPSAFPRS